MLTLDMVGSLKGNYRNLCVSHKAPSRNIVETPVSDFSIDARKTRSHFEPSVGLLRESNVTTEKRLEELYRCYGHLVLLRCKTILRDDGEAEDVMHDVFERAILYKHSLAKAESGLLWLYRVAERCCFDRLKKRRRQIPITPDALSRVAQEGLSQSAVEAREVIVALLERFEPKVQQVALLYYVDGLRQEEIAHQLGWSRRTVIKKLALLRRQAVALVQADAASPAGGLQ